MPAVSHTQCLKRPQIQRDTPWKHNSRAGRCTCKCPASSHFCHFCSHLFLPRACATAWLWPDFAEGTRGATSSSPVTDGKEPEPSLCSNKAPRLTVPSQLSKKRTMEPHVIPSRGMQSTSSVCKRLIFLSHARGLIKYSCGATSRASSRFQRR